ncbi:MAG TPA: folylpolyglutamate synthase/dihydrofolate synthase family protein [Thermodesulfobacteriota bacterium]|nr:folylpolyglutamate synthase/dihydrofolate synthase family protein [Thermodesulfobacteriota bacterium]
MDNAYSYLNSLGLHKIKPGLGRIKKLLESLGNPHNRVPGIIVGGTNGKGSAAAAIASMLRAGGYRTGLYTSPHLIDVTERIRIYGREIERSELARILLRVKRASEKSTGGSASYFETLTASAFVYFAESGVDFSVLEVGMGGRWDATNVITPLVSVITNVSKDHTDYLGKRIEEIASEKARIIKPGVPAVTCARGKALRVIAEYALRQGAPLRVYGRDFKSSGESADSFDYTGSVWTLKGLSSNLSGHYQTENLSAAVSAVEALYEHHGIKLGEKSLRKGLGAIEWPGRLETIRKHPPLILDSAHNPGGAKALAESLKLMYPSLRFTFLVGMLTDKDHSSFINELVPIAGKFIATEIESERALSAEVLARKISRIFQGPVVVGKDYRKAYRELIDEGEPACIAGSLYLTGAIKALRGS